MLRQTFQRMTSSRHERMSRHKVQKVAVQGKKAMSRQHKFSVRKSQHNVEMELCHDTEIYCRNKI